MAAKPLIAVPAYSVRPGRIEGWIDAGVAVPEPYIAALKRAGAQEAVLLPEEIDATSAHDVLEHFDGLLLIGGPDVDPATYGQEADPHVYGVHAVRDAFELALARAAVDRGMPTLAICRGAQVLNVMLGGSLDQHITGRDGLIGHGTPGVEGGATLHDLDIDADSRLAEAMGTKHAECSSHHHQAVDRLGEGLRVTVRAPDGVVEGIELAGDAWIVGAQWHPEDTAGRDRAQQALFDTFVMESKPG
ncbi:MAG: gamma-glutamyl-gamma-aminobutyrate hydrolase family protein [Acidimicrobiia bacterium]